MFSLRGNSVKVFFGILSVFLIAGGIIILFMQPTNYEKTNAVIISIEEDPNYIPDPDTINDMQYVVRVKYSVDGKEYTADYGYYSSTMKVGDTVEILYDPKDPSKSGSPQGPVFGYIAIGAGIVILVVLIVSVIRTKK